MQERPQPRRQRYRYIPKGKKPHRLALTWHLSPTEKSTLARLQ